MDLILLLIWPGFRICVYYAQCYTVSYAKKIVRGFCSETHVHTPCISYHGNTMKHKRKGDYFWNLKPTNI